MNDVESIGTGRVIGGIVVAVVGVVLWIIAGLVDASILLPTGAVISCSGMVVKAVCEAVYVMSPAEDDDEDDVEVEDT